ncbi:MAG: TetR/AcrR family transcriptional regulator C-terminal domain-containing protein [Sciscionella sp.]
MSAPSARRSGNRSRRIVGGPESRAFIGPNAVRRLEQSLAAIAALGVDAVKARRILATVDSFTLGHFVGAATQREARNGLASPKWQQARIGYIEDLIATGEFPHLAGQLPNTRCPQSMTMKRSRPGRTG